VTLYHPGDAQRERQRETSEAFRELKARTDRQHESAMGAVCALAATEMRLHNMVEAAWFFFGLTCLWVVGIPLIRWIARRKP
jgi:type IV secretory pathway TrbD component